MVETERSFRKVDGYQTCEPFKRELKPHQEMKEGTRKTA